MVAPDRKAHPETWLGLDVDVVLVEDDTRHVGKVTALSSFSVGGEMLTENMPSIKLEDGRTVHGYECWWTPIVEDLPR